MGESRNQEGLRHHRPTVGRRLSRRNSSLNRPRKPPDTYHPKVAKKSRDELVDNIETAIKDLVRKSEELKLEIGKIDQSKAGDKHDNHDTSDSGIVTDDSEAKFSRSKRKNYSHYEEAWQVVKQPSISSRSNDDMETLIKELERLQKLNISLEKKEEQIVALNFEYKTLAEKKEFSSSGPILSSFTTEVAKLRDLNCNFLCDITENRNSIKMSADKREKRNKVLRQLEFDLNMIEKEGLKLENSLLLLQQVDLSSQIEEIEEKFDNDDNEENIVCDIEDEKPVNVQVTNKISYQPVNHNHQNRQKNKLPEKYIQLPSTLV